ncbi:MAG: pilus assembly protein [Betaproteobacteria bacterium]|nr:pilus assembly protein [Betaproteobacteria bacterium]
MDSLTFVPRSNTPRQAGAVTVEFALVAIFLMLIVAGIIEFGRAFWYLDAMTKATRDGARYLSTVPSSQLGSVGVPTAEALVVAEVNDAGLIPQLATANVNVSCVPGGCQDVTAGNGTAPVYVTVAISGYPITIGGMIPFFAPGSEPVSYTRSLAPSTTMRYME